MVRFQAAGGIGIPVPEPAFSDVDSPAKIVALEGQDLLD